MRLTGRLRAPQRFVPLLAVLAAGLGLGVSAANANHYAGNFPEWSYPYTQANNQNCTTSATDPINFAFKGSNGGLSNSKTLLEFHMGWYNSSGGQQDLKVKTSSSGYACRDQGGQRASGSTTRYHTRLWQIPYSLQVGKKKTAGDAHYEKFIYCGHATRSFTGAIDKMINNFSFGGHAIEYDYWGNTRSFRQCDGSYVGSGGAGYYFGAGHTH